MTNISVNFHKKKDTLFCIFFLVLIYFQGDDLKKPV